MIQRDLEDNLLKAAGMMPVVTVTGPRQSGKTTLCRHAFPDRPYANLEIPESRSFANDDPRSFLAQFPEGAVLDEIQRCPDLLSWIQGLVDEDPRPGRWILTGSQNLLLLDSVSQSLAGRVAVLNLMPLTLGEMQRFDTAPREFDEVLLTGGYPRILDREIPPRDFLNNYIATYVERDVRSVTRVGDLVAFQRFLELAAGRTAQLLNLSSLASDCGVSQPTVKSWLSILETSFIAMRLPAWHGNTRKRLIRSPKLHFWDSGLVCRLLGIQNVNQLRLHPLRGAIVESWAVADMAKKRIHQGRDLRLHHYRDRKGMEVDLVEETAEGLVLVEVKAGRTIHSAMGGTLVRAAEQIGKGSVAEMRVVHGGDEGQTRHGVRFVPWSDV